MDRSLNDAAKMLVKVNWGLFAAALLFNASGNDKKMLATKIILINYL